MLLKAPVCSPGRLLRLLLRLMVVPRGDFTAGEDGEVGWWLTHVVHLSYLSGATL